MMALRAVTRYVSTKLIQPLGLGANVAIINIRKPSSLNNDGLVDLCKIWQDLSFDANISAIVLSGRLGFFCGGLDQQSPILCNVHKYTRETILAEIDMTLNHWDEIEQCARRKICVAAVNGKAYGAGFEIALVCDAIVCGSKAEFAFPEVKNHGIIPGFHGISRLRQRVPPNICTEIVLTGKTINAEEAKSFSIINQLVHSEDNEAVIDEAIKVAGEMSLNDIVDVVKGMLRTAPSISQ